MLPFAVLSSPVSLVTIVVRHIERIVSQPQLLAMRHGAGFTRIQVTLNADLHGHEVTAISSAGTAVPASIAGAIASIRA